MPGLQLVPGAAAHQHALQLREGPSTGGAGVPKGMGVQTAPAPVEQHPLPPPMPSMAWVPLSGDQEQDSCVVPSPSLPILICCTAPRPVVNQLCRWYQGCRLNPNGLVSQGPVLLLPLPPHLAFASIPIKSPLPLVEPLLSSQRSDNS